MHRILDARYKNVDLNKVIIKQCQYLNDEECNPLLSILRKQEGVFDGTIGTCNTTLVDLKLFDNAKPVCSRPYLVTRLHEAMLRKEVERLVNSGVLEEANH